MSSSPLPTPTFKVYGQQEYYFGKPYRVICGSYNEIDLGKAFRVKPEIVRSRMTPSNDPDEIAAARKWPCIRLRRPEGSSEPFEHC